MPSIAPVEGLHYIFDRYAYLGVAPEANAETIKAKIRALKIDNHPDKYSGNDDAVVAQMKATFEKATECERILTKPENRAQFDIALKDFKTNAPDQISNDGIPFMQLLESDTPKFYHTALFQPMDYDAKKADAYWGDVLSVKSTEELEALRVAAEHGPEILKDMYYEAFSAYYDHVRYMERQSWQAVGRHRPKTAYYGALSYPDQLVDHTEKEITEVRAQIPAQIERHENMLQIGLTQRPLALLTHGDAAAPESAGVMPARIEKDALIAAAEQAFDERTQVMRDATARREAVLEELLELVRVRELKPVDKDNPRNLVIAAFNFDKGVYIPMVVFLSDTAEKTATTIEGLATIPAFDAVEQHEKVPEELLFEAAARYADNVWMVVINPVLVDTPVMETVHFINRLQDEWNDAHDPQPDADAMQGPAATDAPENKLG